jgi:hypothetical protein
MINHPNRSKTNETKERPVVVTTAHRGVFFGYAEDTEGETIKLRAARNCIYWPVENKGFMGLAAMGPVNGARVGPAADISLRDITSVIEATEEAVKAWEESPWSR